MFPHPETHFLPGNPDLPILVYRHALATAKDKAVSFEEHYFRNDWHGIWHDTIYTFRHFHTNAHEALGIAEGKVKMEIGGENGKIIDLVPGDLIVIPAGTSHRRLSLEKVKAVGGYPKGMENFDIGQGAPQNYAAEIAALPTPHTDPLYGAKGPLVELWRQARRKTQAA